MTLVVARTEVNARLVVGDWRITRDDRQVDYQNPSYLNGTLKVLVLSDRVCVSFAGDVSDALNAIRQLQRAAPAQEMAQQLLVTQQAGADADFIVSDANEDPIEVKDGILRRAPHVWIGDSIAFEEFQSSRDHYSNQFGDNLDATLGAMDTVTGRGTHTAGEVSVAALSRQGPWRYVQSARGPSQRPAVTGQPPDIVEHFSYSVLVPTDAEPVVALELRGKPGQSVGAVFRPLRRLEPHIVAGLDGPGFRSYLREQHGLVLRGIFIEPL